MTKFLVLAFFICALYGAPPEVGAVLLIFIAIRFIYWLAR